MYFTGSNFRVQQGFNFLLGTTDAPRRHHHVTKSLSCRLDKYICILIINIKLIHFKPVQVYVKFKFWKYLNTKKYIIENNNILTFILYEEHLFFIWRQRKTRVCNITGLRVRFQLTRWLVLSFHISIIHRHGGKQLS